MKRRLSKVSVRAYEADGLLLEQYAYTPGAIEPLPKHSHEEYQFALSFDHEGEYAYRGQLHHIPAGRLSIVHSGEAHAPSDRTYLSEPAHFVMMHIHPKWLKAVFSEILGKASSDPFFSTVLPSDSLLNRLYLSLALAAEQESSQLEQDVALWNFLSCLIGRYAKDSYLASSAKVPRDRIARARNYLHTHYSRDISLEELANVAELSRFHFCRVFHKEMGVSASTYQMQLRLAQAKRLLAQGHFVAETALATGFYDQSHFGKHFKRFVGTTPARYNQIAISS